MVPWFSILSYNIPEGYIKPNFGILLDMVGASNAVFPKEEISRKFCWIPFK